MKGTKNLRDSKNKQDHSKLSNKISKKDFAPRNYQSVTFEILLTATTGFVMSVCLAAWLAGWPPIRLPAWNTFAPTGRIFMKFDI
jgi:hypothetical protein